MGQGTGNDGLAEDLTLQGRVFAQHLFPPQGTQLGLAGRRSIGIDIGRIVGREFFVHAAEVHRSATLGGNAYGGIEPVGFGFRLGRLAENTLRKKEFPSKLG